MNNSGSVCLGSNPNLVSCPENVHDILFLLPCSTFSRGEKPAWFPFAAKLPWRLFLYNIMNIYCIMTGAYEQPILLFGISIKDGFHEFESQ